MTDFGPEIAVPEETATAAPLESTQIFLVNNVLIPPSPADPGPVRKNPAVVGAMMAAVSAVVVGVLGVSGLLATQPSPDCAAIVQKYDALMGTNPNNVEILTMPGTDGKSVLSADRDAVACGIDEETLRRMVGR